MSSLSLANIHGEPRISSLLLAQQLDNQHKNVIALIREYLPDFNELGTLAFQTRKSAGVPTEYALLNEDQSYLLLTYSRNSLKVRKLKVALVKAFREARANTSIISSHYLPLYHALHDEIKYLALRAEECGSTTPERIFHINANKALNAVMGIASGGRDSLDIDQRLLLSSLMAVYRRALHLGLEAGNDHKEAARKAKTAALTYMESAGCLLVAA